MNDNTYCVFVYNTVDGFGNPVEIRESFPHVTDTGKTETEVRSSAFSRLNELEKLHTGVSVETNPNYKE